MIKTNAMRLLDKEKINYREYTLDISEALDGVTSAGLLGIDKNKVFKTLVTISKSKNYYVFVIPVDNKLDLKKAAKIVGEKSVDMLPMKELLSVTGYVHGGCSPIGMKKNFKTIFDADALNYEKIVFSGGKIGHFIEINVGDIKRVIQVEFADVVED